jgi:hypothetical protein
MADAPSVVPPNGYKSWDDFYAVNPGAVPTAAKAASAAPGVAPAAAQAQDPGIWGSASDNAKAWGGAIGEFGKAMQSAAGVAPTVGAGNKDDRSVVTDTPKPQSKPSNEGAGGLGWDQWEQVAGRPLSEEEKKNISAHYRPIVVSSGDPNSPTYSEKVAGGGPQWGAEYLSVSNPIDKPVGEIPKANPYGSKANEQLYHDMMAGPKPAPQEPVSKTKYWGFDDSASYKDPKGQQPTGPVGMNASTGGPMGGGPYAQSSPTTAASPILKKPLAAPWMQPAPAVKPAPSPAAPNYTPVSGPPKVVAAPAAAPPVVLMTPAPAPKPGFTPEGGLSNVPMVTAAPPVVAAAPAMSTAAQTPEEIDYEVKHSGKKK